MFQSILARIATFLVDKLLEKLADFIAVLKARAEVDNQVDEELEAHKKIVEEIDNNKKEGKGVTDAQKKRLRETSRNLIRGTFSK